MARNTHHYATINQAVRTAMSMFRRGEFVPSFTVDFSALLNPGETLITATWYCRQPYSVVMSNPVTTNTQAQIALQCQWGDGSILHCEAVTSFGDKHSKSVQVVVRMGPFIQGEPTSTTQRTSSGRPLVRQRHVSVQGQRRRSASGCHCVVRRPADWRDD